ncbi:hypothetical protein SAMN02745866_02162 [Alteromonadaceae bacterium Bs31]|nr:hypothetical protein SAMN02745866_02162 [Alteromonadaceae bacterium Bs31]
MRKASNEPKQKKTDRSPFHQGEQAIQERLGVKQAMEAFGRKVIRDHLPEQHREFYNKLPFILLGHCDDEGWPWASIISGAPGFISSKDNTHLRINGTPPPGDPLLSAIKPGTKIGGLGIEPENRRRNRFSAIVQQANHTGLDLTIEQTFGNCPQYIQARTFESHSSKSSQQTAKPIAIKRLDNKTKALIAGSDTFYVASSTQAEQRSAGKALPAHYGADVSHRGGQPGFIEIVNDNTLIIPDYLGNNHYNTLGNFTVHPRAGLLFIDDKSGDLLTLTGSVEIIWNHPLQKYFDGAERFWSFTVDHGFLLEKGFPFKIQMQSYSPNTYLTGTWAQARALQNAEETRDQWRGFRVTKKKPESNTITSFYLEPENGILPRFEAGQFLNLQVMINGQPVIRPYTISSAPGQRHYRLSVKREQASPLAPNSAPGLVSNFLHDALQMGDRVLIKPPNGKFVFNTNSTRPAVMLAAGIGITPIISMLKHALLENIRTRSMRPITVFACARSASERSFTEELKNIEANANGFISIYWILSRPEPGLIKGLHKQSSDYQFEGRLNKQIIQSVLPIDDYDFYLCGPDGFMQSTYDSLLSLGVKDAKINAESFGPSALKRKSHTESLASGDARAALKEVASEAVVSIHNKKNKQVVEQLWQKKDESLLEFAESHGFTPEYSCRNGTCGACSVKLENGEVSYLSPPAYPVKQGDALLCCARPASSSTNTIPHLAFTV